MLSLAVVGGFAAGCGGSSGPGAAGASGSPIEALRQYAACVRSHGVPSFPDPVVRNGQAGYPDSAPRIPDATINACRVQADRLPPTSSTAAIPNADFQKLLQLARCLRSHGLPSWPDPRPDGAFAIGPGTAIGRLIASGGKRAILGPLRACEHLNPDRKGRIHVG